MALLFDAVGPSSAGAGNAGATSLTWAHTITGTNTVLVVGVGVGVSPDGAFSVTCTYNGVAMTAISAAIHSNASTAGFGRLFGIIAPAGTANVVATVAGGTPTSIEGGSLSFKGAFQTFATAFGAAVTNTGSSATPSVAVTGTKANNILAGFVVNGSVVNSATAPSTSRWIKNQDGSTAGGNAAGATSPSTGGSVTMAWSVTNDWWATIAVEVQSAARSPFNNYLAVRADSGISVAERIQ